MKRFALFLTFTLIAGLMTGIPLYAQGPGVDQGGERLSLVILIDQLELTPTQMKDIHDILAGLIELDLMDDMASAREKLYQDLLRFNGSREELGELLEDYKDELTEHWASIKERVEEALVQLKGIITIRQGEILEAALLPRARQFRGMMHQRLPNQGEMLLNRECHAGPAVQSMQRFRDWGAVGPGVQEKLLNVARSTLEEIVEILELKLQYIEN
jgi:hypothetical protein